MRIAAPAKINLYLHVTGRRPDGYHLLDSLVAFADVHDTLLLAPADDLSLTVEGPFAPALGDGSGGENLVLRAARALAAAAGIATGARMTLIKRLPVASGIGGGSSDAAAAIRGLTRLWGISPAAGDLDRLALDLGADVPVCLAGRAAFMSGIGERIDPAGPLPAAGMVLVNPGVAVSTPEVFRRRTAPFSAAAAAPLRPRLGAVDVRTLVDRLEAVGNDLAAPAMEVAPVIADVLEALAGSADCRLARVSGSGATCFGLFDDAAAARAAAGLIAARRPEWWVVPSRLVDDVTTIEPIV